MSRFALLLHENSNDCFALKAKKKQFASIRGCFHFGSLRSLRIAIAKRADGYVSECASDGINIYDTAFVRIILMIMWVYVFSI